MKRGAWCALLLLSIACAGRSTGKLPEGDDAGSGAGATTGSGGAGGSAGASAAGGRIIIDDWPPPCGDGNWDNGEECDDGNDTGGDCCNEFCIVEPDCDCPTPPASGACIARCGDGFVLEPELCDDGNDDEGDGCAAGCYGVTPGWQCRVPGRPCGAQCGDGVLLGAEQCDDGSLFSSDGCSTTCLVEPGWTCVGAPSICTLAVCGNGVTELGEACDHGTENGQFLGDGSGCSLTCTQEPLCSMDGTSCTTACGDANIDVGGGEECDDGNGVSGDGCSEGCALEPGFACADEREPSGMVSTTCTPICGDEIVTVTEECDDGTVASDTDGNVNENGKYGGCDEYCHFGPFCGDGLVSEAINPGNRQPYERCDDGFANVGAYGAVEACAAGCHFAPFCGDGVIQEKFGEQCDDGAANGNGACSPTCYRIAL